MPVSGEKARGGVRGLLALAPAFALAFAGATLTAVLLLLIFLSGPAPGSAVAASFEGEAMNLPSGAGMISKDGAASGGQTLVIWSDATASKRASTPRVDRLIVRAKADQCQGSPRMTVEVDGRRAIQKWVWQTRYANHGADLDLARGTHIVKITMGHDYRASSSCDRNLRVDKVSFVSSTDPSPPDPGPGPATGSDVFEGAKLYVDPYSSAKRQAEEWRALRPADAAQMDKIAAQPDADWFGGWSGDGDALRAAVDGRVTTITGAGALPVLVAYNIPDRDCGGHSGGGAASPEAYRAWIRSFADGIGSRKAAVILEPDAVALTGCLSEADEQTRLALMRDAINVLKLRSKGNTAVYVDAGHSGWVGAQEMAARLGAAGIAGADGFSLNVSNFGTTAESVGYGKDLSSRLAGQGHPGKRFVVDTSRNGLGPSPDGQWCNPPGRALGERPTSATADPLVDAYLWVKAPGESDGTCNGGPPAGAWWPEYALGLARRG